MGDAKWSGVGTTVELREDDLDAARREAARRGVDISEIVGEAVRRFVVGAELHELLDEFRREDAGNSEALNEQEALRIAAEELAALRRS